MTKEWVQVAGGFAAIGLLIYILYSLFVAGRRAGLVTATCRGGSQRLFFSVRWQHSATFRRSASPPTNR